MPREKVASFEIERLEVLDEDGNLDGSLEPDLSDDDLVSMYKTMKRARALDERAIKLQRRGEIGTFAPAIGQEAAQVGSAYALEDEDWMVPSFREKPAFLTRGAPMEALLWYDAGLEEGAEIHDRNDLPPAIPVASQTVHAAGIGWAQELEDDNSASLVYFGDGATSEGDFHEALNFANVFDAHTVFVCQNNQYAISLPREEQTKSETLAQKAVSAGVEAVQVDGNDLLAVYKATRDALEKARQGKPQMVEAVTYRLSMHTTSDDPSVYRDEEEVERWKQRDPIDRIEKLLRRRDVLDDATVDGIEEEIDSEVDDAVESLKQKKADADPADIYRYVYDEIPDGLLRQMEARQGVEE
ncbi:MAG: pyruvate dehydrogenase (acetyl-transferring) E1 component subunit alpha [Halobacteria archaeon]|nr:pyruvate dehydrogenase (acetyl-transferring) E1 component subunit alpha [Halobacteria archaeon]